jgi:hypothetical protein
VAQEELRPDDSVPLRRRRALLLSTVALLTGACEAKERPIGLTLLFLNHGKEPIGVIRFDPDGQRGPVPGALGASLTEGKQMTFMPGDSTRAVPQWVEVEWVIETPEIRVERKKRDSNFQDYTPSWIEVTEQINKKQPRVIRRVDLAPILTPALVEQVRANRQNTNLKLKVIFKDDQVFVEAAPEKWR